MTRPGTTAREPIRAQIVLKGRGGDPTSGDVITAQNVRRYISDPAVRDRVRHFLEEHGFSVDRVGPFSIAVAAPRRRFEKLFRGRLKKVPRQSSWTWASAPIIPAELREAVASVVLPQPAKLLP
jgi:hypothetical protein